MQNYSEENVQIYHLIDGAKQARGLTVIIDVFRAFSLEAYLFSFGAKEIRPVGSIEESFAWREKLPGCLLVGERKGRRVDGFDFGNSPSSIPQEAVTDKTLIHTTSAGTQGIVNACGAEEILTGSLVNAAAIAAYIKKARPSQVSLVAMGNGGISPAPEDELCAGYIRSLLLGKPLADIDERIAALRFHGGEHFFDPDNQEVFPQPDFYLCAKRDIFDFVIRVEKNADGFLSRRIG